MLSAGQVMLLIQQLHLPQQQLLQQDNHGSFNAASEGFKKHKNGFEVFIWTTKITTTNLVGSGGVFQEAGCVQTLILLNLNSQSEIT